MAHNVYTMKIVYRDMCLDRALCPLRSLSLSLSRCLCLLLYFSCKIYNIIGPNHSKISIHPAATLIDGVYAHRTPLFWLISHCLNKMATHTHTHNRRRVKTRLSFHPPYAKDGHKLKFNSKLPLN